MQDNRRYVERIRARHAILAIVARNRVELHHALGRLFEKGEFLARELFEGRIGAEIVLEVLHFHHSAQNRQHPREAAREPERPRRHAHFGLAPLELGNERVRYVGEPAAQERLHYHGGYSALVELPVKVFGIGVAVVYLLGVLPVEIVELDLHEVPLVDVVFGEQVVENPYVAMVREPEVAYAPGLALGEQEFEDSVVDVARPELLHSAAHTDAVQEHVVDVVRPQLFEGVAIYAYRRLPAPRGGRKIGELCRDKIFFARVAAEGYSRGALALAAAVRGRCVKIVDAAGYRAVNELVDRVLVDFAGALARGSAVERRPAHATEPEQRNLLARLRIFAHGHFARRRGSPAPALRAPESGNRRRADGRVFQKSPAPQNVLTAIFHKFFLRLYAVVARIALHANRGDRPRGA